MSNFEVIQELSRLSTDALLQLFVLDASSLGGSVLLFYPGTDLLRTSITWQGLDYEPMPSEVKGFAFTGEGSPPRPTIVFGNVAGTFSSLCLQYEDLVGARIRRKRVFARYLDGMPGADPTKYLPDDIFQIERKVSENRFAVEFELGTSLDIEDTQVPLRTIYANLCGWQYRGDGCGFASNTVRGDLFDNPAPDPVVQNFRGVWAAATHYAPNDVVYITTPKGLRVYYWCILDNTGTALGDTTAWTRDECSRRLSGCLLRFRTDPTGLPYGGFPSTARLTSG